MIEEIGKLQLEFPIWFLAESPLADGERPKAIGIRGETGFLTLPLFTDEGLAKRFVELDRLQNAVVARIDYPRDLVALLKKSSESFTCAVFNPPRIGSRLPLEYLLMHVEESHR